MRNNKIFCSTHFWETFIKDRNSLIKSFKPDTVDSIRCWLDYWTMIEQSSINFEFDEEYLINSDEEWLQRIWQGVTNGDRPEESIMFSCKAEKTYDDLLKTSPLLNTLYLTEVDVTSKYGMISTSDQDYLNKREYFKDSGDAVEKGTPNSWEQLVSNSKHQFNAMIVMDNYILVDKLDFNLKQILNILLPDEIDIPLHLTIVTSTERVTSDEYLEMRRKRIMTYIREIRPNLSKGLMVEAYRIDKRYVHDRIILTNYMCIGAGGGFNLLHEDRDNEEVKAQKSTKLNAVYPRFIHDDGKSDKWYNIVIKDILKGLENISKSSKNRLLCFKD